MFFLPGETPLIAALDARFSQLMNLPIDHGEGLQVLRYGPGTRYTPHFDFLVPRMKTVHSRSAAADSESAASWRT